MNSYYFKSFIITALILFCNIIIIKSQEIKESTNLDTVKLEIIPVLIIDGFSNHQWDINTKYLKRILESTGKFKVSVSTCPNQKENKSEWENWNPDFNAYPVVIQTCNNVFKEDRLQWSKSVKESFEKYVSEGGGVYMYHAATNAFKGWSAYNKMIALGWRNKDFGVAVTINDKEELEIIPKGEGENTEHGARTDALITRIGNHPIHTGMPKAWRGADVEIYRYGRGTTKNLEVLSYAKDAKTKLNFPMEWTVKYGKGKIYCSTYGHLWKNQEWPSSMRCAAFQQSIVSALQWLSGHVVDNYVDADFPTSESTVLRLPIID
ncbi:MAG: ThuA domain-containing protein [Algibacter sp.]